MASLLRLPAAGPEPSSGSGQVRLFRAAPAYFVYNLVRWGVSQAGALAGLVVGLGFIAALPPQLWPLRYLEVLGVAAFLAQLPFSLAVVWIDYRRRWYLVTDRSLRIREGVWTLHERTMSFANVQNLEIRQGPIHRLLGLAALEVRSAGGGQAGPSTAQGSGARQNLHVAYFRGVDNAEEIRDLILARLRRLRDAGLGDLDEEEGELAAAAPAPATPLSAMPPAVAAAHELLAEARALRALLP
ncbi:MAG TPA: PH domain-containing protein [Thermoanaerobaculia bacterium]|nr:PH domain-containing protein [Thermoanaerobaculia bacterium]